MSQALYAYTPPRAADGTDVPAGLVSYLNGHDLLAKTQAVRLSTVDPDGWPHAALLSAGDAVMLPGGRLRFVIFPESRTVANLTRDGRITLTLSLDGGMCELRMRARRLHAASGQVSLALFEAQVGQVRQHVAPYADVTCGVTFALHDPEAVLARWQRQIATLREAV
ncbi:MAG: pyridoxamine 5'-phosphate oxidase family protein [Chloroflexi bacterium]|nr:pyridoxamine 5'-phosphate oxidase family protein [Chloroflexota bacterium]MBV9597667.1 pyridoxamine 5'-phosphate oxidase family protein [Chloroflexota bacterium]